MIEPCDVRQLSPLLTTIQYIDFAPGYDQGLARTFQALGVQTAAEREQAAAAASQRAANEQREREAAARQRAANEQRERETVAREQAEADRLRREQAQKRQQEEATPRVATKTPHRRSVASLARPCHLASQHSLRRGRPGRGGGTGSSCTRRQSTLHASCSRINGFADFHADCTSDQGIACSDFHAGCDADGDPDRRFAERRTGPWRRHALRTRAGGRVPHGERPSRGCARRGKMSNLDHTVFLSGFDIASMR